MDLSKKKKLNMKYFIWVKEKLTILSFNCFINTSLNSPLDKSLLAVSQYPPWHTVDSACVCGYMCLAKKIQINFLF